MHREMRNIYKILIRKYEAKRPLGRYNIKMSPREAGVRVWTGYS
jgi:hypothetical protein